VRSRRFKFAVVFPKISTEISDEAMPIEDLFPSTGKFNRWQTPKSTKFSDAPESMRTCTCESFNVPSTTADPKLDGADARKGWCTDGTGAVIAAEATSFDEPLDQGFFTWGAEINFRGCWGRSHMWQTKVKGIRLDKGISQW